MADDLTKLAQSILDLDKGVETKRAELARIENLVMTAERERVVLNEAVTKLTSTKAALEIAGAELQRDNENAMSLRTQLVNEVRALTEQKAELENALSDLRQRIGA